MNLYIRKSLFEDFIISLKNKNATRIMADPDGIFATLKHDELLCSKTFKACTVCIIIHLQPLIISQSSDFYRFSQF